MSQLQEAREGLRGMKLFDDKEAVRHVWEVRKAGLGATAFIPGRPDTYEGWEDSAVPPARLGEYLRRLRKLASKYDYESALYGHHGEGCVHARWNFDLTSRDGMTTFRRFLDEAVRSRARARRLALGRARRRAVAGGAPAEDSATTSSRRSGSSRQSGIRSGR